MSERTAIRTGVTLAAAAIAWVLCAWLLARTSVPSLHLSGLDEHRYFSERALRRSARFSHGEQALRLATRAQHLMRWKIPRSGYPMDRAGYHRWRTRLYEFHAEQAAVILRDIGYDEAMIGSVQALLRKERIKSDPDMQLLEDVICLVFLESYFHEFAQDHDEPKLVTILQRTWKKMSPRGQQVALELSLPPQDRALIERALKAAREAP